MSILCYCLHTPRKILISFKFNFDLQLISTRNWKGRELRTNKNNFKLKEQKVCWQSFFSLTQNQRTSIKSIYQQAITSAKGNMLELAPRDIKTFKWALQTKAKLNKQSLRIRIHFRINWRGMSHKSVASGQRWNWRWNRCVTNDNETLIARIFQIITAILRC